MTGMGRISPVGSSLLVACCALSIGATGIEGQTYPDLSGVWVLNYELSDDPRRQVPLEVGERPRSRGPTGGGFGGFGGGGFGAGGGGWNGDDRRRIGPSIEEIDALRAAVADQLTAPRQMTITQDRREILFSYDDGRYVRIVPDGKEHAGIADTSRVMRKVHWQGQVLFAEVKFQTNQKIFHQLELRHDGEQLVLITILEARGAQDEVRLRRVYDLAGEL